MQSIPPALITAGLRGLAVAAVMSVVFKKGFSQSEALATAFLSASASLLIDDHMPFLPTPEAVVEQARSDAAEADAVADSGSGARRLTQQQTPSYPPLDLDGAF